MSCVITSIGLLTTAAEVSQAQTVDAGITDSCLPHQDGGVPPDLLAYCPYPLVIEWEEEGFKVLEFTGDSATKAERGLDEAYKKLGQIEELLKKNRHLKAAKTPLVRPVVNDARTTLPRSTP